MLKIGIIGAGRLGNVHAGNIAQLTNAKLAAVYDIAEAPAKNMSERYGAEIFASPEELVSKVDAVVVASPSDCHLEGVRAAVNACKSVFTEKPLCRFAEQAEDYKKLLSGFDKTFGIGFVRRHMYKSKVFKDLLDEGKLGKLKFCNVDLPFGAFKRIHGDWFTDYRRSGGVILDMLAHHMDLANWFFGRPVLVYAQGLLLDPTQELPSDYVSATVTYENGVIANMMCSWQRFGRSGERMEVYGNKGALTMTGADMLEYAPLGEEIQQVSAVEEIAGGGVVNASTGNGFMAEMKMFVKAVETGSLFTPGIPEAFTSFAVAEAMMRSAETGKSIEIKQEMELKRM